MKSHQKFKDKFELPFPLISDEAKDVAQAFGVWREKKMYGKTRMGIVRSTFIIGPDGLDLPKPTTPSKSPATSRM